MIIYVKENNNITINGITLPKYVEIDGEKIAAKIDGDLVEYVYLNSSIILDFEQSTITICTDDRRFVIDLDESGILTSEDIIKCLMQDFSDIWNIDCIDCDSTITITCTKIH